MEQTSVDEEEQLGEVMVLQSIFEKDVFECDVTKKPYNGQLVIHLHPGSYGIFYEGDVITFMHLPPWVLSFSLPPDYPSRSPPTVRLSCVWLTSSQLEAVAGKLKRLFEEGSGAVVLYTWTAFLQDEALDFLSVRFPVSVESLDVLKAISSANIERIEEEFKRGIHECPVCFCERQGTDCLRLRDCDHVFCRWCLAEYLSRRIEEGGVRALFCPADDCKSYVNPDEVKLVASERDYERYERFLLQRTLDSMPDVQYCPRPGCGKPVIVEEEDGLGLCTACDLAFCIRCRLTYHGRQRCYVKLTEEDMLEIGKTYATSQDDDEKRALEEFYGKREVRDFAKLYIPPPIVHPQPLKMLSPYDVRRSPCCGEMMQKISGCDHMFCPNCKLPFNWSKAKSFEIEKLYSESFVRRELMMLRSRRKRPKEVEEEGVVEEGETTASVPDRKEESGAVGEGGGALDGESGDAELASTSKNDIDPDVRER